MLVFTIFPGLFSPGPLGHSSQKAPLSRPTPILMLLPSLACSCVGGNLPQSLCFEFWVEISGLSRCLPPVKGQDFIFYQSQSPLRGPRLVHLVLVMSTASLVWEERAFHQEVVHSLACVAEVLNKFGGCRHPLPPVCSPTLQLERWKHLPAAPALACAPDHVPLLTEKSAQHRLGSINSKLSKLENTMTVVESKLASAESL